MDIDDISLCDTPDFTELKKNSATFAHLKNKITFSDRHYELIKQYILIVLEDYYNSNIINFDEYLIKTCKPTDENSIKGIISEYLRLL